MKKHIFWIVPLVLYIFAVVLNYGATYFNRNWFNVKHVLYFGVIIYVLVISLYAVYRFFILRYIKQQSIKIILGVFLCTLAIVGTISASNLQIQYINKYEVPHIKECAYYDQFGNAIYKSLVEACPELVVLEHNFDTLSFTVSEIYEGNLSEPYAVENGIGTLYYEGIVHLDTEVSITYTDKSTIETMTYTIYETISKITDSGTDITGAMFQEKITTDFDQENMFVVTYETKSLEVALTNSLEYPSFDDIEPVIRKYTSEMLEPLDGETGDSDRIVFKEITYDEEGIEIVDIFAYGRFDSTNEPLVGVDFYENGVHTGDSTDYSFKYDMVQIKNRQETLQSSGVDRRYDERVVTFIDTPVEFYSDDIDEDYLMSDTYLLESFDANLNSSLGSYWNYDLNYSVSEINGDIFINDSKGYYHKFVFTEYGVRVEEYTVTAFDFGDLLPEKEDEELLDVMIDAYNYELISEFRLKDTLNVYDYKKMIEVPGGLSNFHFYQHNHLVEYPFYGVHERFD